MNRYKWLINIYYERVTRQNLNAVDITTTITIWLLLTEKLLLNYFLMNIHTQILPLYYNKTNLLITKFLPEHIKSIIGIKW